LIRGLIFDFDGLLVDTEIPAYQSWQEIYAEYGCELPLAVWATCIGTSGVFDACAYLEEQAGRPLDREAVRQRRAGREQELVAGLPLLPGVQEYLSTARRRGLRLGIASSSSRRWVEGHLARLGVRESFDQIVCREDVARVKPDPELYLTALARMELQPDEAVVLEDSPNGILAARRAGLFSVAVPNALTGQLPLDHADLRLTSLADTPLEQLIALVHERHAERIGAGAARV
jgi:HAD superfamily hydrolase (TIGR01509 family)